MEVPQSESINQISYNTRFDTMKASHTSQTDIITSNQHTAQLAIAEHN